VLQGRLLHRRDLPAARDRLALAEHALRTTTGQADQAAERQGMLRRHQQRRLGWLDAHDAQLRLQERAVTRELGWRGRVDQRALALDPPSWLLAELGPLPSNPQERRVWGAAAAHLDGFRRAYGLDHLPPAEHGAARTARGGRAAAAATPRAGERNGPTSRPGRRRGRGQRDQQRPERQPPTQRVEGRQRGDPGRLLGAEPHRDQPGRRHDWQAARAALERLVDRHRRHRDQRHPTLQRPGHTLGHDLGRDVGRDSR
jgi:hypothetical protein